MGRSNGNDWVYVWASKKLYERGSGGSGPKMDPKQERRGLMARDRGVRHLSYEEITERRQKGLCFKCGGASHPCHQCLIVN